MPSCGHSWHGGARIGRLSHGRGCARGISSSFFASICRGSGCSCGKSVHRHRSGRALTWLMSCICFMKKPFCWHEKALFMLAKRLIVDMKKAYCWDRKAFFMTSRHLSMHADAGHRQRLSLASGSALPGQGTTIAREWRDFRPRSVGGAAGELALFPYLLYVAGGHSAERLTDDWGLICPQCSARGAP